MIPSTSTALPMGHRPKIKLAFLGGAYDSAVGRVHRVAIEMDQLFELVAGCFSRDAEKNRLSATKYGVDLSRVYENLDVLLEKETGAIDAIVILTPTGQHYEQVTQCLMAGVPVICEKSLVCASSQALSLKNTLLSTKGFLAVTYNYTAYPIVRELKKMVKLGHFGRVEQIQIEMPQEGFSRVDKDGKPLVPQDWRLHDEKIPTISLDLGVHLHSMVYFLTDQKPIELVANSTSYGNFPGLIDNVSCLANYTNQMSCSIWYSKTALGQRNGLKVRLYGELGSAEWLQEQPEFLHLADKRGGKTTFDRANAYACVANEARYTRFKAGHPAGFIEAFANYYEDVADQLQHYQVSCNSPSNGYVFGIDEVLEGMYLLEAIVESSSTRSWVKVNNGQ